MYYQPALRWARSVENIERWLDKAEQFASSNRVDLQVHIGGCFPSDMKPLIYQVQSACYYLKAAAAWLSGQTSPEHDDDEQSINDLRARIRKTVNYVEGVAEASYKGAEFRRMSLSWEPGKVFVSEDYLLQIAIPTVYFHIDIRRTSPSRRRGGREGFFRANEFCTRFGRPWKRSFGPLLSVA